MKYFAIHSAAACPLVLAMLASALYASPIALSAQRRDSQGRCVRRPLAIEPAKTAVVVVDMWDKHWCTTYTARVGNLVPRMNRTLDAARKLGIQVVFAPSDVVRFYQDAPQRKAMQAVPPHAAPTRVAFNPPAPPGPTDFCECGPSQPCKKGPVWTRQQPDLKIAPEDLIADCNNGGELLNLCAARGIDTLIYMGVASNMCVQYRSMGIRNMKSYGLHAVLVADLVQAITSNGLDAEGKKNLNFTPAGGTARIQQHIEQHVCPTIESRQLLERAAGKALEARSNSEARAQPHVVFVSAEMEYGTKQTLPTFARQYLADRFRCTFLAATADEGSGRDDIPGLEAVDDADLLLLAARRRSLPVVQMDHLERHIRAGKPLVALRVSAVPFQTRKDPQPGYVVWDRFDQEVLGCNYQGYNSKSRTTGCDVKIAAGAADHPILKGLPAEFRSPSWLYRQRPLSDSTRVLLTGRWSQEDPDEPVAWTNTYQGGRVFYTTLGHPGDFQTEPFNRMLLGAIRWCLDER